MARTSAARPAGCSAGGGARGLRLKQLDQGVLSDLAIDFTPRAFLRVTPLIHRAAPLGLGFGNSRFSSPTRAFKILYIAADLATAIAETVVRDRFEGRLRRRIDVGEIELWGVTEVAAAAPLRLVDLRTTGLLRLGVSTNAARAKSQRQGRALSEAIHSRSWPDGILYASRLTGATCCAVYDRSVAKLSASPVVEARSLAALVPALSSLGVEPIH